MEAAGASSRLSHSKTQQAGLTATSTPEKPVLDRAARGPSSYGYGTAGMSCPIPSCRPWGRPGTGALGWAGLEGNFGGHSLRAGFVAEASRQGITLPAIMQMTEHRAVASGIGYFYAGEVTGNPAARLLED